MKISLTFSEALQKSWDWDALCNDLGLNPYCINDGLVNEDEELILDYEVTKKHGLIK